MQILLIGEKRIDWNKDFPAIRQICENAITEDYVRSLLPEFLKKHADEKLSFGFFDPKHTMIKDLTHDFRKMLEFSVKARCAQDREYAQFYDRIAREKEKILNMFGIETNTVSSSEIFKDTLTKIRKSVPSADV
jgi:hypothetical protein